VLFGNGRRRLPLVYVDNLVDALCCSRAGLISARVSLM